MIFFFVSMVFLILSDHSDRMSNKEKIDKKPEARNQL